MKLNKKRLEELKGIESTNELQIECVKEIKKELELQGIEFDYKIVNLSKTLGDKTWKAYQITYTKNNEEYQTMITTKKHTNIHLLVLENTLKELKSKKYLNLYNKSHKVIDTYLSNHKELTKNDIFENEDLFNEVLK